MLVFSHFPVECLAIVGLEGDTFGCCFILDGFSIFCWFSELF